MFVNILFIFREDMMDHCYSKFDKSFFASVTKKFAQGAIQGDLLCLWLFQEAGKMLAASIVALWPRVDEVGFSS